MIQGQHGRTLKCLWYLVIVISALSGSISFADDVNIKRLYKSKWVKAETNSFNVLSNAGEKQTRLMAEELENFSFFMSKILGYKQKSLDRKVPVVLVKNQSSFSALGISKDYVGMFSPRNGGVIYARADKFRSSSKGRANWGRLFVLHELVHLLQNNTSIGIASPPWYSEGTAEYFSTYVHKRNKIMLGDMSLLGNRFYSMLNGGTGRLKSIDSEELFKTEQSALKVGQKADNEQDRFVGRFYARSLAVVHYLNSKPELRRNLYKYLALIEKGYSIDETFDHVFGESFEGFDKKVNAYIAGRYLFARVFDINRNGISFPQVTVTQNAMSQRKALEFLYPKIAQLSPGIISEEELQSMNADLDELIPDFFAQ